MSEKSTENSKSLSRRDMLLSSGAASLAAVGLFKKVHGLEGAPSERTGSFLNDPDHQGRIRWRVHEGKGEIDVKIFFNSNGPSKPAILLLYDIPPGASEGVHTHNVGDVKEGSFDEFYYILSGSGEMRIAGETLLVKEGDHIFTPNGVAHGIENSSSDVSLKVYLVAVMRD